VTQEAIKGEVKRMKTILAALILTVTVAMGAGCAMFQSARPKVDNPLGVSGYKVAEAQVIARDVMLDLGFEVESPLRSVGRIDAMPLVSASWFEFWRPDTVGKKQRMEASIHTMRRFAEILVSPTPEGVTISARVTKQRKSAPGRQIIAVSEAYSVFDEGQSSLRADEEQETVDIEWEDLGRDSALEQVILKKIRNRLP
jgi:hypothetical protein